ncbi:unnamed protein product [Absidia cylindrospora]
MVQASSFLLLFALSAVMIQGAPLAVRSKDHHALHDESKLQGTLPPFPPPAGDGNPGSDPNYQQAPPVDPNGQPQTPGQQAPGINVNGGVGGAQQAPSCMTAQQGTGVQPAAQFGPFPSGQQPGSPPPPRPPTQFGPGPAPEPPMQPQPPMTPQFAPAAPVEPAPVEPDASGSPPPEAPW